jgi:hypothetical protein
LVGTVVVDVALLAETHVGRTRRRHLPTRQPHQPQSPHIGCSATLPIWEATARRENIATQQSVVCGGVFWRGGVAWKDSPGPVIGTSGSLRGTVKGKAIRGSGGSLTASPRAEGGVCRITNWGPDYCSPDTDGGTGGERADPALG